MLHPNLHAVVAADMDLLRLLARLLHAWAPAAKWLNPQGMVEDFATMLTDQLDMRIEASNLRRLHHNFNNLPPKYGGFVGFRPLVVFPEVCGAARGGQLAWAGGLLAGMGGFGLLAWGFGLGWVGRLLRGLAGSALTMHLLCTCRLLALYLFYPAADRAVGDMRRDGGDLRRRCVSKCY